MPSLWYAFRRPESMDSRQMTTGLGSMLPIAAVRFLELMREG